MKATVFDYVHGTVVACAQDILNYNLKIRLVK